MVHDTLELTVLSHPVTVRYYDPENSYGSYGVTERDSMTIRIKRGMAPSLHLAVLLHEVVHISETILGHEFTEQQVDAIAATFYSLLKDNPKIREMFS